MPTVYDKGQVPVAEALMTCLKTMLWTQRIEGNDTPEPLDGDDSTRSYLGSLTMKLS